MPNTARPHVFVKVSDQKPDYNLEWPYAGFIVEEDIDSLLFEASQVFERVNAEVTNLTSCFSKHLKVTNPNTVLLVRCLMCQLQEPVIVEKEKLLQVVQVPVMALLKQYRIMP